MWNGDGAGGGGCSAIFEAQPWPQNVAGWGKVGCHRQRAVADVAADADPYTGVAVHDTSPDCKAEYEEGGVIHEVAHWCTIGGTSLASPLVAAVFALAGGAKGAPDPARTIYQNRLATPSELHDVTSGSNGEVAAPHFRSNRACPAARSPQRPKPAVKASASASPAADTTARPGWARRTGPQASCAHPKMKPPPQKSTRRWNRKRIPNQKETRAAKARPVTVPGRPERGKLLAREYLRGAPKTPRATTTSVTPEAELSTLALTRRALIALNGEHPKLSQVGFAFMLSTTSRVQVTLARRSRSHSHAAWVLLHRTAELHGGGQGATGIISAAARVLSAGVYRLTLTPAHGSARSIFFQIG